MYKWRCSKSGLEPTEIIIAFECTVAELNPIGRELKLTSYVSDLFIFYQVAELNPIGRELKLSREEVL